MWFSWIYYYRFSFGLWFSFVSCCYFLCVNCFVDFYCNFTKMYAIQFFSDLISIYLYLPISVGDSIVFIQKKRGSLKISPLEKWDFDWTKPKMNFWLILVKNGKNKFPKISDDCAPNNFIAKSWRSN